MRTPFVAAALLLASCGKHAEPASGVARDTVPITITTSLPGASPTVIADSVTTPLERQLGQAVHLERLHSRSSEGRSVVLAEFAAGTDVDVASQEVQTAINAASQLLPPQLPAPPTYTRASRKGAVLRMIVASEGLAIEAVAGSAREIVAETLSQVAGVGDVEICGPEDETRIIVNLDTLAASGQTIDDVRTAIVSASLPPPGVGVGSKNAAAPDYAAVPILRDAARVETDKSTSSCVARGVNNARVLGVTVTARVGVDPLEVRERVEALIPKLAAALPAMRVQVWPRTRPRAYEIVLDPSMAMETRTRRLERVITELELSTQSLLQLGLPDHDPDVADLRIVPPADPVEVLDAHVAAVLERHDLAMLGDHDHIVGFSGADPAALRKQASALVTALAAAKDLHVVEEIGVEQQPRKTATVDRDRATALGITSRTIDTTLAVLAPGGMRVSTTFTQHAQAPVMLAVEWDLASALDRVMVRSTTGSLVPLSAVVAVTETPEADVVLHEGQFPWVGVRVAGPIAVLNDVLAKVPVSADIKRDVREPD